MPDVTLDSLTIPAPETKNWNDDGFVILEGILPDALIDTYCKAWIKANGDDPEKKGWQYATPYMHIPELLDLCSYGPLHEEMEKLIREPVGLHLNLSDWVSTERDWHQDTYLNPPHVGDYYIAAWMALDDIHEDSGPFQLVPGSHLWFQVTQSKMLAALTPEEAASPHWPRYSERILTPLFEEEIPRRGVPVMTYLPKKGDVLLWHSRLLHRGSRPNVKGMERRALIAHYSGIHARGGRDMPYAVRYDGGWIFPLHGIQPV